MNSDSSGDETSPPLGHDMIASVRAKVGGLERSAVSWIRGRHLGDQPDGDNSAPHSDAEPTPHSDATTVSAAASSSEPSGESSRSALILRPSNLRRKARRARKSLSVAPAYLRKAVGAARVPGGNPKMFASLMDSSYSRSHTGDGDGNDDVAAPLGMAQSVISLLTTTSVLRNFNQAESGVESDGELSEADEEDEEDVSDEESGEEGIVMGNVDVEAGTSTAEAEGEERKEGVEESVGKVEEGGKKTDIRAADLPDKAIGIQQPQKTTDLPQSYGISEPSEESTTKHSDQDAASVIAPTTASGSATLSSVLAASAFEQSVAARLPSPDSRRTLRRARNITGKLREFFDVSEDDEYVADFTCWLLADILLQGHLYLTSRSLYFLAFLPDNEGTVVHSGFVGRRTVKGTSQVWAVLRDNVFSLHASRSDMYFPLLTVDLRYAVRADADFGSSRRRLPLLDKVAKSSDGDTAAFCLVTEKKTHRFTTESPEAARQWLSVLQKQIFQAQNAGNSVRIAIPLTNVLDVTEASAFNAVAHTVKVKVLEDDESFAVDDYFFAFFQQGKAATEAITAAAEAASAVASVESDNGRRKLGKVVDSTAEVHGPSRSTSQSPGRSGRSPDRLAVRSRSPSADSVASDDSDTVESVLVDTGNESHVSRSLPEDPNYGVAPGSADAGWGGWIRMPSLAKRVESTISAVGKVGDMWSSEPQHYAVPREDTPAAKAESSNSGRVMSEEEIAACNRRFQKHFALTEKHKLVASYYGYLQRSFPLYGKIYLSERYLCFRSLIPGLRTKMLVPMSDVETVKREKGFRFGYSGLVVVIQGHEEVFFEFSSESARDDCEDSLAQLLESREREKMKGEEGVNEEQEEKEGKEGKEGKAVTEKKEETEGKTRIEGKESVKNVVPERPGKLENTDKSTPMISSVRLWTYCDAQDDTTAMTGASSSVSGGVSAVSAAPASATAVSSTPPGPLRFTCLTIGSRGDVQPYIALAKRLQADGHEVSIATHGEFGDWVRSEGVGFAEIAGNPADLMQLMVEHGTFSVTFLREAAARFRSWIDDLLSSAWRACQDTDVLIESPSAMAGIHIAEALGIAYFRAFTMPWTRTRAYPHAFMVPDQKMGGSYNYLTHVMFEAVFWKGISGQVNRWRASQLGLPRTSLEKMQQGKVPFIYNVSPAVFLPPVDFSDWVTVSGYWFLDQKTDYEVPESLVEFISQARADGKKLVYIGFGSIVVANPRELTRAVLEAVREADVRCVLSKGWSDRGATAAGAAGDAGGVAGAVDTSPEPQMPPEVYRVDSVPHDWLFPQIDAAVHHGGSGTTGASLRAGLPTVVKPFFGDQFFYANRVEDIGVGVNLRKLTTASFARALQEVTTNQKMIAKARAIGERISQEDGVGTAVQTIYREMEYARTLSVSKRQSRSGKGLGLGLGLGYRFRRARGQKGEDKGGDNVGESLVQSFELSGDSSPGSEASGGSWQIL